MAEQAQDRPIPDFTNMQSVNVPLIYTNAILVYRTLTDIQLTLTVNGKPSHQVVMPLPTGKALIEAIQTAINDHINKTGEKVLDLNQLSELNFK